MCLRQAVLSDLNTVKYVAESTISEVYPHYYPRGAVNFFLKHHSEANIVHDIEQNQVFLCQDAAGNVVGTVTVSGNEIRRLFVLPAFQKCLITQRKRSPVRPLRLFWLPRSRRKGCI